ncbi:sensor histidine kinase [Sinosporangium siamense]|uniref:histidine kinase n=1 Tax=Sinosporangium siamense TaxID=1367973 RepID=A0A919RIA9_9ACTN|nr:histidine kinase [Sinosporangium siamense]GII94405.1 ATPase [Sinosporangium siamense]
MRSELDVPDPRALTGPAKGARWAGLVLAATVLGVVSAAVEVAFLLVAGPLTLLSTAHPRVRRSTRNLISTLAKTLCAWELRRLRLIAHVRVADYDGGQAVRYLAVRWLVGAMAGLVLLLFAVGAGVGTTQLWGWARGHRPDGIAPEGWIIAYFTVVALVVLFLIVMGIAGAAALDVMLATRALGPRVTRMLEIRIAELARTRAGIVVAVDAERRRIERDLHDGVQQRLVALAMLIGRARRGRSPELRDDLLRQAHEESQRALDELRQVAWRVYPTELDTQGLREALTVVAERAGVPTTLAYGLAERPPAVVETAVYFMVREAVTNAAKHAGAVRIEVDVTHEEKTITVRVRDDGRGGADPGGGGLSGLARRVAALDGRFHVDSPAGGPTTVTAELPCG